jgi:mono/diheme cytochrome c family protein
MTARIYGAILVVLLGASLSQAATRGDPQTGKAIYQQQGCAACHGENAEGIIGPSLHGKRLAQVQKVLKEGYTISKLMPLYPQEQISDAELEVISLYLQARCNGDVAADIASQGEKLFAAKGCVACHLPDGSDGVLPQSKGHRLWGAQGVAFVNKVRKGIYAALRQFPDNQEVKHISMPRYPHLTESQVVDLTAYLQSFCLGTAGVD